jgi:hypothetical protein
VKRNDFVRAAALGAMGLGLGARPHTPPTPEPGPTPIPTPDAEAERLFGLTKEWWRGRKDAPYLSYGALIRYKSGPHVFDNWWNATFRTSDRAIKLERIPIPDDEAKRLRGFPITIFGFKIADTNADAEPIRVEVPQIDPTSDFGIVSKIRSNVTVSAEPTDNPLLEPSPGATGLREIGQVEVALRDYDVRLVGEETLRDGDTYHLKLTPLRDPGTNRLRDIWMHKETSATLQLNVGGIFNGLPYDRLVWTVLYVQLGDRWYVQQVRTGNMHFGLDTNIDAMEFDFVDFRFPADVPAFTFDKLLQ